jgi:DNA-binding transcriptional LysR family regulator
VTKKLDELLAFLKVAETQSFRVAGERLGLSASALSHAVTRLERRLQLRLLHRTTRSVSLTQDGARLQARLLPAFGEIEQALGEAALASDTPQGLLHINAPKLAIDIAVMPRLPAFLAACPQVKLKLEVEDALVDIVAQSCDAGIRLGESLQQDMVAARISDEQRVVVVASPAYLARRGEPRTPADLLQHACIGYQWSRNAKLSRWAFVDGRQRSLDIGVAPVLITNDTHVMLNAALAGVGLARTLSTVAQPLVAAGALRSLLEPWCPKLGSFYLYHAGHRHIRPALRAFVDSFRL